MTRELRTFLTFQGGAASGALDHYRDVFDDFELIEIDHYGPRDGGPEGTVKVAKFRLADSEFSCADSPVDHVWGFQPAVSLWIECNDVAELEQLFDRLSDERHGVHAARRLRIQHPLRLGRRPPRRDVAAQPAVTGG